MTLSFRQIHSLNGVFVLSSLSFIFSNFNYTLIMKQFCSVTFSHVSVFKLYCSFKDFNWYRENLDRSNKTHLIEKRKDDCLIDDIKSGGFMGIRNM